MTVTETWHNEKISDNEVLFNDYSIYRRDREDDNHSGICTFIRKMYILKEELILYYQILKICG